jgi:pimeloyl-ACP methyl ester carboxylesterase
LLVAVLIFLVVCCCGSVLYWYENLNSPEERIPAPKPGIFSCLFHYCATLASCALCIILSAAGPLLRRKPALNTGTVAPAVVASALPPLILIHGLSTNAGSWLYMAKVLDKTGYNVSTYVYSSFFVSLDAILRGLDEHVATVERQTGQKPILIGHSLGGLLSRKWLEEYNGNERVRGIITLGTPHGGSKMAVFGPGALARSIRTDGSLVLSLRGLPPAAHPPCTSLVSPGDNEVLPASCLLPPPEWNMRLTPILPHFAMLFSPQTAAMLLEELRTIRAGEESPLHYGPKRAKAE